MATTSERDTLGGSISRIKARRPLQAEIRQALLGEFILSGRLSAGDRMPSEAELAELFGASRVTIRTALQSLKEAGYIRVLRGSGSWVLPRPETIHSGIDRLVSFDTFASQAGKTINSDALEIVHVTASEDPMLEPFGAVGGATRVSRAKTIDGAAIAWIVDYVPDTVMSLAEVKSGFAGSVLDMLLARGIAAYSDCEIIPVAAHGELRLHLGCAAGAPVLRLSEITRTQEGDVVNRSDAWLLPDAFTFQVRRRPDGQR